MERRSRSVRRLFKGVTNVHQQPDGVYFTNICIGGQCFTAIVDTGSTTIAVPCAGCECGSGHSYFDALVSPTVVESDVSYLQCYGEGSCNRGKVMTDSICFGANCTASTGVRHPFGCCDTFARSFQVQQADGIIGLSPNKRTLWKDLVFQILVLYLDHKNH